MLFFLSDGDDKSKKSVKPSGKISENRSTSPAPSNNSNTATSSSSSSSSVQQQDAEKGENDTSTDTNNTTQHNTRRSTRSTRAVKGLYIIQNINGEIISLCELPRSILLNNVTFILMDVMNDGCICFQIMVT